MDAPLLLQPMISVLNVVSSSYASTRLFACAIAKKDYPDRDPVEMAFEDLCKRFDLFLAGEKLLGILSEA